MNIHRTLCNVGMKSYKFNKSIAEIRHTLNNSSDSKFDELIQRINDSEIKNTEVAKIAIKKIEDERRYRKEHLNDNLLYYKLNMLSGNSKTNLLNDFKMKINKLRNSIGEHNMFPLREFISTCYVNNDLSIKEKKEIAQEFIILQIKYWKTRGINVEFVSAHLNEDAGKNGKIHTHLGIFNACGNKWGWKIGYMKRNDLIKLQEDYENNIFKPLAKKFNNSIVYIENKNKTKKAKEDIWNIKLNKILEEAIDVADQTDLIDKLTKALEEQTKLVNQSKDKDIDKYLSEIKKRDDIIAQLTEIVQTTTNTKIKRSK